MKRFALNTFVLSLLLAAGSCGGEEKVSSASAESTTGTAVVVARTYDPSEGVSADMETK